MSDEEIRFNIEAHNKVAGSYEGHHVQIFNPVEQGRIREHLAHAISLVNTSGETKQGLDFGCGTGNVTAHMEALGLSVTAADVAEAFLRKVEKRFAGNPAVRTVRINGTDLREIPDGAFDVAVAYAVLHHVPEYLTLVGELVRVTRPGGVIMIDREAAACFWKPTPLYREFAELTAGLAAAQRGKPSWTRFLKWETYVNRWKIRNNPRYQPEGDIHIWEDDHIGWDAIRETFASHGCEIVWEREYLGFDGRYPVEVYDRYKDRCADDMVLIARKRVP